VKSIVRSNFKELCIIIIVAIVAVVGMIFSLNSNTSQESITLVDTVGQANVLNQGCIDRDGGDNPYVSTTITQYSSSGQIVARFKDNCLDRALTQIIFKTNTPLFNEYYCNTNGNAFVSEKLYSCTKCARDKCTNPLPYEPGILRAMTFTSEGLDVTTLELGYIWNDDGSVEDISARLDMVLSGIDSLNSQGEHIDLVIFPEFGASIGTQPLELQKNVDGTYTITSNNELSYVIREFILELSHRRVSSIISTVVRKIGEVPNNESLWTYFNSYALFVSYDGKIFDTREKYRSNSVMLPDNQYTILQNLNPEAGIDRIKTTFNIPIYTKGNITSLYIICAESYYADVISKSVAEAPIGGNKLFLYAAHWPVPGYPPSSYIKNILPLIQNGTYANKRSLNNWGVMPNGQTDIAKELYAFKDAMNNTGYLFQADMTRQHIGAINVNFDTLKDYGYVDEYLFWAEVSIK
jgi:hypothetical protein